MDNYEVNVLTRKGGWKKLPQEVVLKTDQLKLNNSDNLNINVNEETIDNDIPENFKVLFQSFPSITSAESRILLYSKNIL